MPNATRHTAKSNSGAAGSKVSETANASTANMKTSPRRHEADSEEGPTGEVAKELARLSALILEKAESQDKKLEEIRVSTSATESKLADIANRICEVESRLCFLEDAHRAQEGNPSASKAEVETLRQKMDDFENRERRNNLRFMGFHEGCEEDNAVKFLEEIIPKIFNINFPKGLEIERAHRLGSRPGRGEGSQALRPRPIIARFLRFQDRDRIAEAARKMGTVTWERRRIMVFADYSKLLSDRRMKFRECKKLLHEKNIRFSLNYPAVLMVKAPQGPRRFEDHKEALAFITSLD
ncbi:hypothetical protein OJAV_G00210120 [Oryzias javanicus]|uniref:L1 transposable element RRM domain-containing protein n=1 Tax=Oryzias javanicus TaxID=123683 RepID=A0A3S2NWW8_ORYJA|nr:hypothetical protein OJAV_G00210120 [Oryzias javanicus]